MEYFKIPENPEYTEQIRKFKTTDKAHADLFNEAFQALITNEAFLKKVLEKQGVDTQGQLQQQYEQLTSYTDTRIGQLINGAPETLDTIKEVADAILENETIVEALNDAVGKKLNKDGDLTDAMVTFTSADNESPTSWKDIGKIISGKVKEILNRVSVMSNNLKFLYKLCGTTDISGLADGTITGAISMLNTGIIPNYLSYASGIVNKQGWHRIAKANDYYGYNSCVISLKRSFNVPAPEYQKIQLLVTPNKQKFVSLAAISDVHIWTKIRETWDETNFVAYLEVYQCQDSNTNAWNISLMDAIGLYNSEWKAIPPELTQETVSGVTVLTSLDLPANNPD